MVLVIVVVVVVVGKRTMASVMPKGRAGKIALAAKFGKFGKFGKFMEQAPVDKSNRGVGKFGKPKRGGDAVVAKKEVDTDVHTGDAGSSHTYPVSAGSVRKGFFVMLKGRPCKVADVSTSKTGKHGHAKANIMGYDIFTNKKYEDVCPTSHNVDAPFVTRQEYNLMSINDGFLQLLDENGATREDLRLPESDVGQAIDDAWRNEKSLIITCLRACGEEMVMEFKEDRGGSD